MSDPLSMKAIRSTVLALLCATSLSSCCLFFGGHHDRPRPSPDSVIERIYATPSGDWGMNIQYEYGADGRLAAMHTDYFTFSGYDPQLDDFRATICKRFFRVAPDGKLMLVHEEILDDKTKQPVKRSFYEPEVKHWMTLAEAQRESLKEEKERALLEMESQE